MVYGYRVLFVILNNKRIRLVNFNICNGMSKTLLFIFMIFVYILCIVILMIEQQFSRNKLEIFLIFVDVVNVGLETILKAFYFWSNCDFFDLLIGWSDRAFKCIHVWEMWIEIKSISARYLFTKFLFLACLFWGKFRIFLK